MTERGTTDFDVVIVGSGPAGVSAAFPLVEAGLRVMMVDGGRISKQDPPAGNFLEIRKQDKSQWRWMLGEDFYALRQVDAVSPKFRVPTHAAVFEGFAEANQIKMDDFVGVGSLAPGGLSNAWGCGVACFTNEEINAFPVAPAEMRRSYEVVARRIGVSGGRPDDLSDFFGLDELSQPPIPIDEIQGSMFQAYAKDREALVRSGFRMGRSRLAALTEPKGDRKACDRSGNCLWGCSGHALYSATEDIALLRKFHGFYYRPGLVVDRIKNDGASIVVFGKDANGSEKIRTKRALLAAGTLASTRLALQAINYRSPISMQSCPTAAFMLWLPLHLGRARQKVFSFGQLSFTLDIPNNGYAYGALFDPSGIPLAEFSRHMPFGKQTGVDFLKPLLTSCVVGNMFLPGEMTKVTLHLEQDDSLNVRGVYRDDVPLVLNDARRRLSTNFRRMGAIMLPGSFRAGRPGSDIHYAASIPMCENPARGQTDCFGELVGAEGVHLVDGASLPTLFSKPHTLTIMANSDRIARHLAQVMS